VLEVIYFIACEGFVKIGVTTRESAASRMEALQTGNPFALSIIHTEKGGHEKEKRLHERFASLRVRGEWFKYDGQLVEYVSNGLAITWRVAWCDFWRSLAKEIISAQVKANPILMRERLRCPAVTASSPYRVGQPCSALCLPGQKTCGWHSPDTKRKPSEAGKKAWSLVKGKMVA
jgi:hypothetical protein